MTNLSRHIWEGWTAQDFVDDLEPQLEMIMSGDSWQKPLKTKDELKEWCMSNQPYYKKYVPEVVNHFAKQYKLK